MKNIGHGIEALVVFVALMVMLWLLPKELMFLCYLLFGLVIASWRVRKNALDDLGLLPDTFDYFFLVTGVSLGFVFLLAVVAQLFDIAHGVSVHKFPEEMSRYILWAFFQQLLLCGYFTNRFFEAIGNKNRTALWAGTLFAVVHLPNPVLVPVTLVFGIASARIFLENRNIYTLALAHATIGAGLGFLSYTMRIGPGYFLR